MSQGVLQYTLGLGTSQFTKALDGAGEKASHFASHLLKLTGVGAALGAGVAGLEGLANIYEGVMGAFERGAGLAHLSKQTGETVANLYLLQKGLKAVGGDADATGTMVTRLERSLGGVNNEGIPTAHVFGQLGLNIEDLKKMDAPRAMLAIAGSMGRLNDAGAVAAASKIFGREGAQNFLLVAHESEEFARALRDNARAAQEMQRNAGSFLAVEMGLKRLKAKGEGLFAGIAAGLAPALDNVLQMLNGIDLSGLGEQLGKVLSAFIQAFKEGKLTMLIAASFKLGFDAAVAMAPGVLSKLGVILLKIFETPLIYLQAGLEWVIDKFANNMTVRKILAMGTGGASEATIGMLGLSSGKETSFADIFKERKARGLEFGAEGYGLNEMNEGADKILAQGMDKLKGLWGDYSKIIGDFNSRAPKAKTVTPAKKGEEPLEAAYQRSHTSLEKMGFVMRGSMAADPAAATAKNTATTNRHLVDIKKLLGGGPGGAQPITNTHA